MDDPRRRVVADWKFVADRRTASEGLIMAHIPFNIPLVSERELDYVRQAIANRHLAGNGPFTAKCHAWLESHLGVEKALLTHSCTAALEMAAILAEVGPGDEVIMPSYTFVSTANAFVLRGATPVFVDIREDTCNLDETLIEAAITPRTKVIVVVHYAGVACNMDPILGLVRRHGLILIEDVAQGFHSTYRGRPLGSFGHFAALSFHETKNVIAGEGGALIVGDAKWALRSEIVWEKGTNRSQFFRGAVEKYTWVDIGSSYLPSEINAAFLLAQLEAVDAITSGRLRVWNRYHQAFEPWERKGAVRRPSIPADCRHNGHLYYLLFADAAHRSAVQSFLRSQDVDAVLHYVPLHSSPAGRRFARTASPLRVTEGTADRLLRLPIWAGMTDSDIGAVTECVARALVEAYAG
jgi:dTDP-4-amino-4,6-dideoxygalactose transaminase